MAKRPWEEEYSPEIVDAVKNRDYATGGADAVYMTDEDYAATLYDKSLWGSADAAGRNAIHDRAEQRRAGYGYSGGDAGDEYNKLGGYRAQRPTFDFDVEIPTFHAPELTRLSDLAPFTYENAPEYINRYQDMLDQLTDQYVNRGPFEYDYATDPRWQAYKKQYTREGRRASEDAMGQMAAMTGGMPSTAAMTAAQQANDYYNARMTDKIPELAQLAYQMYLGEGDEMRNRLNAVQGMEQSDYNKFLNSLSQWNNNRNFAYQDYLQGLNNIRYDNELAYQQAADKYGRDVDAYNLLYGMAADDYNRALSDWETGYGMYRDSVADQRYADETAYAREQAAKEWDYGVQQDQDAKALAAAKALAGAGDTSLLEDYYGLPRGSLTPQDVVAYTGGGSGGGSGGGTSESGSGGKWDDVDAWAAKYGEDSAESYIREHYRELGYKTVSEALNGWKNHTTEKQAQAKDNLRQTVLDTMPRVDGGSVYKTVNPGLLPAPGKKTERTHSLLYEDIDKAVSSAKTDADYQKIMRMLENGYASGEISEKDYDELLRKMGY